MCGRFYVDPGDSSPDVARLLEVMQQKYPDEEWRGGEIFPGTNYPVLVRGERKAQVQLMQWGFLGGHTSRVINARAETIEQRTMFRDAFSHRRCAVLASWFYEWKQGEEAGQFRFGLAHDAMYLGGIWDRFSGVPCFTVLTRKAEGVIAGIHDRMPVILRRTSVTPFLTSVTAARELIGSRPPELRMDKVNEAESAQDWMEP